MKTVQVKGYLMGIDYAKLGYDLNVFFGFGFNLSGTLGTECLIVKKLYGAETELDAFISGWCHAKYGSPPDKIVWSDVDA
jgi:hypothetical protein